MSIETRDRNLLFAILALQNNFITQPQMLEAFREFTRSNRKPISQLLRENGSLAESATAAIEMLVEAHLKNHGIDSEASLAAIDQLDISVQDSLRTIDPGIESGLLPSKIDVRTFDLTLSASLGKPTNNGRFQILRPYAKGGLGEVFVARDEELDREVALKQILGESHGTERRERFVREAEITGKLEHPGIVPVYGLGADADGNPYYAMRFIRGQSLREAIRKFHAANQAPGRSVSARNREFHRLLGWFIDVCNAISYAHSRGVLHRDIKPSNVMIGRFGETLVVDWGLARVSGAEEDTEKFLDERPLKSTLSGVSTNTMEGQAVGTPAYMSPEQANGRLDQIGPHSDVYCLGSTLYSILTGKAPHAGNPDTVLKRVASGDFPLPNKINEWVPKPLEAICLKAMAFQPPDRYATPGDLVLDVEAWIADEPVSAWSEPVSYQLRRWVRRNQTAVFGVAIGILTIAGAAMIASVLLSAKNNQLQDASETIRIKNLALMEANENETAARLRADRVKDYLVETFQRTDPTQDGRATTLAELLDSSLQKIDQELDGDPLTQAEMYASIGRSYVGLGLYEEAKQAYDKELSTRQQVQPADHADILRSQYRVSDALWRLSSYPEAVELISRTLEKQQAEFGKKSTDTMSSMNMLALCYQAQGKTSEATGIFAELVELRTEVHGAEANETLLAINNLASSYDRASRFQEANQLYQSNLEKQLEKNGDEHPHTALAKQSLANNLRALGEFEEAIRLYREVLEYRQASLGESHPDTLSTTNGLVLALQDNGQYADTVPLIEMVLDKHREHHGNDHIRTLRALNTLGMALVRSGKISAAIPVFEESLPAFEKKYGEDNSSTMSVVNNLAFTYLSNGDYSKSVSLFERAYKNRLQELGPKHHRTILSYNNLALALYRNGDLATSLPMMRESYEQWKAKEGEDHFNTLSSARMLGTELRAAGYLAESREILERTRQKQIQTLGSEHPNVFYTEISLASTLAQLDEPDAALNVIKAAAKAIEEKFGPLHPQSLGAQRVLGECQIEAGNMEQALEILSEALQNMRREIGPSHPTTLRTLSSLATAHAKLGNPDEAARYYISAINQQQEQLGESHPHCLTSRLEFAEFLLDQGEHPKCEKQLEKLWKTLPTQADHNLLPSEVERRDETISAFVEVYRKMEDEAKMNEWNSKTTDGD